MGSAGQVALDTDDVDVAREHLARAYCEHRLTLRGDHRSFRAVQRVASIGDLHVHRLRYGTALSIDAAPLGSSVLVTSPREGRLRVHLSDATTVLERGDVVALPAHLPFTLDWDEGCVLRTVQVPVARLAAAGPAPLLHARSLPRARARAWHHLVGLLESEAADHGISPVRRRRLEDLVIATVQSDHAEPDDHGDAAPSAAEARRIVDLARDRPDLVTVADLAAAAHLSVRGLQAALHRHLATTPSAVLREARLNAAHADLRAADPQRTTVAEVAHRHGFGHTGRFARYYAERFGVPPSQTLRTA